MAEAVAAPQAAEAAAPAGRKKGLVVILTLVGAVAGGLGGAMVLAPRIIARQHPPVAADSAAAEGEAEAGHGAAEPAHEGGSKTMIELENIIVNPAGSMGTRFLMTSVAIAAPDEAGKKALDGREVELRDRITAILEARTMAQLTMPGARDSLKDLIGQSAAQLLGQKAALRVYLPQFVIQ